MQSILNTRLGSGSARSRSEAKSPYAVRGVDFEHAARQRLGSADAAAAAIAKMQVEFAQQSIRSCSGSRAFAHAAVAAAALSALLRLARFDRRSIVRPPLKQTRSRSLVEERSSSTKLRQIVYVLLIELRLYGYHFVGMVTLLLTYRH